MGRVARLRSSDKQRVRLVVERDKRESEPVLVHCPAARPATVRRRGPCTTSTRAAAPRALRLSVPRSRTAHDLSYSTITRKLSAAADPSIRDRALCVPPRCSLSTLLLLLPPDLVTNRALRPLTRRRLAGSTPRRQPRTPRPPRARRPRPGSGPTTTPSWKEEGRAKGGASREARNEARKGRQGRRVSSAGWVTRRPPGVSRPLAAGPGRRRRRRERPNRARSSTSTVGFARR
ncbi:hypothetical protein DMC30DRAFT_177568 [Rhodotorula diobovata]|uniref:Uncharacterized protein n=1 Tax=Rhodotorula diobovata TaxID=5288 RepID=A0A5C5FYG5_9BASI|nr:hypothetical protein DMC30DRAFT_177568 [Rhodotorula diobovata]